MRLQIDFQTTNLDFACDIIRRLADDLEGQRLKHGQAIPLVSQAAKVVGFAKVTRGLITPDEHAAALLDPVIKGTAKRGQVKYLINRYKRMTGKSHPYSTWLRWLHKRPELRMQPAVGTALAIVAAYDSLKAEDVEREARREV